MTLEILGSECIMAVYADERGRSATMILGLFLLKSGITVPADEGDHLAVEIIYIIGYSIQENSSTMHSNCKGSIQFTHLYVKQHKSILQKCSSILFVHQFQCVSKMPSKSKRLAIEQSSDSSYQVQKILEKKIKNGKQLYKVVWKGYPIQQATWQPKSNMNNCSQLILQFQLSRLPEKDKNDMVYQTLNSSQDIKDEIKNVPLSIYEFNLEAVSSIPQLQQIKKFTSILDKHIRMQSQLQQNYRIQEVVQAQEVNQENQPSFYKVRVSEDVRYFKVKRSQMLQNLQNRAKLIEYYQKLDCKN